MFKFLIGLAPGVSCSIPFRHSDQTKININIHIYLLEQQQIAIEICDNISPKYISKDDFTPVLHLSSQLCFGLHRQDIIYRAVHAGHVYSLVFTKLSAESERKCLKAKNDTKPK